VNPPNQDDGLLYLENLFETCSNPREVWDGAVARSVLTAETAKWIIGLADWKFLLTLTFRDQTSPCKAWKLLKRLIRALNEGTVGNHYTKKVGHSYFSYAAGIETKLTDTIHFHTLIDTCINYSHAKSLWWQWAGLSHLDSVRDPKKVVRYVSKTICRGGLVDLYIAKKRFTPDPIPRWWILYQKIRRHHQQGRK
jgi:hypothetical protein